MGSKCSTQCISGKPKTPAQGTQIVKNPAAPQDFSTNLPAQDFQTPPTKGSPANKLKTSLKITTNKEETINSPIIPNEKCGENKVHRSLSAMRLGKEDMTPNSYPRRNVVSSFIKSRTTKYFHKDNEKEMPIIHTSQKKKTLKFRNSQFLNQFLINKFSFKLNFEQVPKKEGDTSVEHPNSQKCLSRLESQKIEVTIKEAKEETPHLNNNNNSNNQNNNQQTTLKFYFKPEFLNELLESIYTLNTAPLKKYELIYEEKTQPHKMKIYWTNYINSEKNKINIFRTEFFAPCHPEFFLDFMNNIAEQTKMDLLLDKYYIAEPFSQRTNVIYLSYKKTIVSSARDFIYLKHWGKIEKDGETWYCDTSRSIEHSEFPAIKNVVRGDIIYSGHVIKLIKDSNGKDMSLCRMYSECDFKLNVPAYFSKKFSKEEMKSYTERCLNRIKELLK